MENKDIDNMLNTLRKHSPDWIDRIRVYINRIEKQNQEAKKEVFDVIDKRLVYCLTEQHEDTLFPMAMGGQEFRNEVLEVIRTKILRHLSP